MQQHHNLFQAPRALTEFKAILKGVSMQQRHNLFICSLIIGLSLLVFLLPTLVEAGVGTFVSDDFNSFNLNTGLWTFIDPVGDATLTMTGTNTLDAWVSISVPAGTAHNVWDTGNQAPRIMQPANDTDFELEVKFKSGLSQKYQMQGVLVEGDDDDFLRFDFHSDGSKTRVFATSFIGGTPTEPPIINSAITATNVAPLYMRVKREGDLWTQSYSYDEVTWTPSISFTHALSVTAVGPFVGNTGVRSDGLDSPAHSGHIDYFFNTASPIDPEDGGTAVDTTPPLIYNVQHIAGQTKLRVTWSTDEPVTGTVRYGETTAYELGSVSHTDFTLYHSLLITGLQASTTYTYQVVSEDSSNNVGFSENFEVTTDPSGTSPNPVIDIWYGSHQVFGYWGIPQSWVNILGNVSDPEGVSSLTYSLNSGSESPLSIGPDTLRLAAEGDFNVDIAYTDLDPGLNQVVITATDNLDNTTVETVTVEYVSGNVWPETYFIDWSSVITIPSVAQIVDGLWTLEADSIHPAVLGYDRLVAIGDVDVSWDDYEVTVPITIHGIDPAGYQPPSNGPSVGILMRWTGHTDSPISGWQPKSGWWPLGAIGMYRWKHGTPGDRLQIMGNRGIIVANDTSGRKLGYEVPYIFKMRVETMPGEGGLYSFKVWEDGQPEPSGWDLTAQEGLSDPQNGSFLLLAHHVDASFGDVTVTPGPLDDTVPPIISNIQVTPDETSAVVTWTTNEPATSTVAYGQTTAYENGSVDDSILVTEHTIILTNLISDTLYHYQITSEDGSGNLASSAHLTFTTGPSDTMPPVISNIQVTPGETSATVTWTTDEPATSSVAYGQSAAYENGSVGDSALVIEHTITLTNLVSETLYHYQVISVDGSGNSASSTDLIFATTGTSVPSSIMSDDFNTCELNPWLWEFIDPRDDATYAMTGTFTQDAWLSISVPAGTDHDIWEDGNFAPRIMQSINDTDFEVEVKFESPLTETYQMQGVLVEEDDDDFLRFEFYSVGSKTRVFATNFIGGTPTTPPMIDSDITDTNVAPLYMRVRRQGDQWTQSYSYDGVDWTTPVTFTHPLTVTAAGTYAGNAIDASSPAHTAYIDYFFNTASPIIPEDGDRNTLTVNTVGNGMVTKYPDPPYDCDDDEVTLTATADLGWTFAGWSGDLSGTTNPVTVTMTGSRVITATFTQDVDTHRIFLPLILCQYSH